MRTRTRIALVTIVVIVLGALGVAIAQELIPNTTLREALERQATRDALDFRARSVGFSCLSVEGDICEALIERTERNSSLREAIQQADELGLRVYPDRWFWFNPGRISDGGGVYLNISVSDTSLITFLTE